MLIKVANIARITDLGKLRTSKVIKAKTAVCKPQTFSKFSKSNKLFAVAGKLLVTFAIGAECVACEGPLCLCHLPPC